MSISLLNPDNPGGQTPQDREQIQFALTDNLVYQISNPVKKVQELEASIFGLPSRIVSVMRRAMNWVSNALLDDYQKRIELAKDKTTSSAGVGIFAAISTYFIITHLSMRGVRTRPPMYGVSVAQPIPVGNALGFVGGGAHQPANADVPPIPNLYGPDHLEPRGGVRRRRRFKGFDPAGGAQWEDYPLDGNTDNGPNRVYEFWQRRYIVPRLALLGMLKTSALNMHTRAPETWLDAYCRIELDDAEVLLPIDTVENLKKWWYTVGFCEENLDLSFVKCNEITRTLAVSAEECARIVLLASCVAALHIREASGDDTLGVTRDIMKNNYWSTRGLQLFLHEQSLLIQHKTYRVAVSLVFGGASALLFATLGKTPSRTEAVSVKPKQF